MPRKRWQFSLAAALFVMFLASLVFAAVSRFGWYLLGPIAALLCLLLLASSPSVLQGLSDFESESPNPRRPFEADYERRRLRVVAILGVVFLIILAIAAILA